MWKAGAAQWDGNAKPEFDQLRLSKENLDTYVSPQDEADKIKDIPPNIADNTINNNLEEIEGDVEQEKLGVAAAADGGNSSVENHYGKPELHVDSPDGTLPKSGARNNMDSNITKLKEILLLVSLKLEESQKSFQTQKDETNKLTKYVGQLQEEFSQLKGKFEEIKQSKINQMAELDWVKAEHKDEVSWVLVKLVKKKNK